MIVHIKYLRVFHGSRRLYIGKLPRDFWNGSMTYIYVMREFQKHFHDVYIRHKGLKGLINKVVQKCNSALMSGFFWKIIFLLPLEILTIPIFLNPLKKLYSIVIRSCLKWTFLKGGIFLTQTPCRIFWDHLGSSWNQ